MGNMIVSENQIKTRRYNLVIDGKIVEEMLSPRMANIFAKEYRAEGFAVDKIEVFSVTKGIEIIGEDMVQDAEDMSWRKNHPTNGMPYKGLNTPEATKSKIERDRTKSRTKNSLMAAKTNKGSSSIRYTGYGREKNSTLHAMYLDNIRRNGYRVYNMVNGEVWIGLQNEVAKKIFEYLQYGGKKSDLDIKFLGSK
jgi:hypothetical protein